MEEKYHTLKVFNTMTGKYDDVAVTKDVFNAYRRTDWNIKDDDERFYEHEIQFSGLIGGEDNGFENFDEFIQHETPESLMINIENKKMIREVISNLDESERELFIALWIKGMSAREYARKIGVQHSVINYQRQSILKKFEFIVK